MHVVYFNQIHNSQSVTDHFPHCTPADSPTPSDNPPFIIVLYYFLKHLDSAYEQKLVIYFLLSLVYLT
jgi:hypothetical protein